jgi:UDP-N-acetylglucosamine--N-acetylmuramyl-(pentapeptide) pyrophosphoryl-undecaprenol N-acetylglucosamine transferase
MKYAVLVAGGTGGHINAALAIGEENVIHLKSKPLRTKNPLQLLMNLFHNFISFCAIFSVFLKKRPRFIVGAGGYVCGPTLLAGFLQFIPVYIIEQNAVMGLTNKILGWISRKIFVHFSKTRGLSAALKKKVRVVGNPTRKAIQPVPPKVMEGHLKVLVFGGSLGATQINQVIFELLKKTSLTKLEIHHQVGGNQVLPDIESSVKYVPMNYIDHIQQEYEWCDVIIARSGASTVSELAIIKKPVLIFPYPQATDNHQLYNAEIFKEESDFTVEVLDPHLPQAEALRRVEDFLVKASRGELKYTQKSNVSNNTCDEILREIKLDVGMA